MADTPTRRIVVRDQPRVQTNVPAAMIGVGAIFVVLALVMYFEVAARAKPGYVQAAHLFAISFGLVGLSLGASAAVGWLRRRRNARAGGVEPWHYDHRWDVNGADDETSLRGFAALRTTVAFVIFLLPFHLVFATVHSADRWILFAVLFFFDVIIVAVAIHGVVLLMKRRKFGARRVRFDRFPYVTGAPIRLTFDGGALLANANLSCQMRNVREVIETTGTGRNRSRSVVAELIADQNISAQADTFGTCVLEFNVQNGEGTDLVGSVPRYWELVVKAAVPGLDYDGLFLIPVYSGR